MNGQNPHFSRFGPQKELHCEQVALSALAAQWKTPLYVYSEASLLGALRRFQQTFVDCRSLICVSVKANSNLSLLSLLAKEGSGFDVVSGGELGRVVQAGGEMSKVVFSGVGKTDEEILSAISLGIFMFQVESEAELFRINELAKSSGRASVRVSLRMNPNVDGKTHPHISTGLHTHKFGLPVEQALSLYRRHQEFSHLSFEGVGCHIGSMLTDLSVLKEAFAEIKEVVSQLQSFLPSLSVLDLGGGLAVSYSGEVVPEVEEYGALVKEMFQELLTGPRGVMLIFEPGRYIFAHAGVLLTKVLYTKKHSQKTFVIVDAGFNDFIRTAFYHADHDIKKVSGEGVGGKDYEVDIVGPICESSDTFAERRKLPEIKAGEFLAICDTGAYGFSMASHYNSRGNPAEVLVRGAESWLIRSREDLSVLFHDEVELLRKNNF